MNIKTPQINSGKKMAAFILMYVLFIFFAQALLKLKPNKETSFQHMNSPNSSIIKTLHE
ncbi:hypothetical protein MYP_2153 [Sporocytophaga myxococcoides]|uniref:Uncharacterized protein n=1 Tax=Sporocytophaga myxococcoides TaxID=153721 RepID=A0A098LDC5_9BACT|nr:hypothetical protein [Sporocytophaga myxococcoides]GAL84925.1 hypothetical protein MYP_2153 [Sporocytophaga myxococcoides]